LKTIDGKRRTSPRMAASASARVANFRFVQRFFVNRRQKLALWAARS
jgi:hypothetical protein